ALFGFHLWLLSRTVARGDVLLSGLLLVAVGLFSWRIVHYWTRFRADVVAAPILDPKEEIRRIRNWSLLLLGLLILHAWLFFQMVNVDLVLASGLALAMAVFVYRLAAYGRRYATLRGTPALTEEVLADISPPGRSQGAAEQDSDELG
ncbi:MAG: hypothetical protein R3291_00955, partial [Thermoplasmata archaeon]|nr:hypothetical protein [Thermoplasmata archaeon]